MTVGTRIRAARKRAGLSQSQLAVESQVSQPTVANWENGSHAPRHMALGKIANALGTSPAWLLGAGSVASSNTATASPAAPPTTHHHVPVLEWPAHGADLDTGRVTGYISAATTAARPFALAAPDAADSTLILDRADQTPVDGASYLVEDAQGTRIEKHCATNTEAPQPVILARALMSVQML